MESTPNNPAPGLAIVTNSVPPYRDYFHKRLVHEIPELKLWTVCTHEGVDARWAFKPSPEINTVSFGGVPGVPDRAGVNWASYRKGKQIIAWMQQNNIRAVIVHGYNDVAKPMIIRWCRKHGIPCFIWSDSNVRADTLPPVKAFIKKRILGKLLSWGAGALACGRFGRLYFEKYGVPPERIFYSPYEPDYRIIQQISSERLADVRRRFDLSEDRRWMVFSGRLVQVKRVDLLIDAFNRIATQRPQWNLLIIGDGALRGSLEQRVAPELRSRVRWTGHLQDQPLVSALYRLSDLLVLPSEYEPWALVVNEAAAAGLAIVASDVVGAAAELVVDGENGRTFRSGDLSGLIATLLEVTDPSRIDLLKRGSPGVLERWRREADPVGGIRAALRFAGVLPGDFERKSNSPS